MWASRSALLGAAIAFLASLGYYTGFFNPMLLPSTPKPITDQNEGETKDPSTIGNEKQVKPQPTVNIRIAKMSFIDPGSSGEAEVGEDTMEEVVHEESAIYETVVVILSGLCAYMTAVGLGLSGITSIVVAGMIMSCYVAPNLSPLSQEWVRVVSMGEFQRQIIDYSSGSCPSHCLTLRYSLSARSHIRTICVCLHRHHYLPGAPSIRPECHIHCHQ